MPLVTIKMIEGRTLEQKRALVEKVTDAVVEALDITPDRVSITLQHMAKDDFAKGGKLTIDL